MIHRQNWYRSGWYVVVERPNRFAMEFHYTMYKTGRHQPIRLIYHKEYGWCNLSRTELPTKVVVEIFQRVVNGRPGDE